MKKKYGFKIMLIVCCLLFFSVNVALAYQAKYEGILNAESQQEYLDSILEKNQNTRALRAEPTPDFVYSGKDKTFYTPDIYGKGESGQKYESNQKISGNYMYLESEAGPPNYENSCWTYLGKEFVYSGESKYADIIIDLDYEARITVNQNSGGLLPGSATASFYLVAEVYDMDTNSRVDRRKIENESIAGIFDTENIEKTDNSTETMQVRLRDGHAYKVVLKAEVKAKADLEAKANADAYDGDNFIKLKSVKIDF